MVDALFSSLPSEGSIAGLSECLIFPSKEDEMQKGCLFGCPNQFGEIFDEKNILRETLMIRTLVGPRACIDDWLRVSGPACCTLWIDLGKYVATREEICKGELILAFRLRSRRAHYQPVLAESIPVVSLFKKKCQSDAGTLMNLLQEQVQGDPLKNWEGLRQRETVARRPRSERFSGSIYAFEKDECESKQPGEALKADKRWLGVMSPQAFKQLLSMIEHGGIISMFQNLLRQLVEIPEFLDVKLCVLNIAETLELHPCFLLVNELDILVVTRSRKWTILRLDLVDNICKITSGVDVGILQNYFGCVACRHLLCTSQQAIEAFEKEEYTCATSNSVDLDWKPTHGFLIRPEVQELGPLGAILTQALFSEDSELARDEPFAKCVQRISSCWQSHEKACIQWSCTLGTRICGRNASGCYSEVRMSPKEKLSLSYFHSKNREVRRKGISSLLSMLLEDSKGDEHLPIWLTGLGNRLAKSNRCASEQVMDYGPDQMQNLTKSPRATRRQKAYETRILAGHASYDTEKKFVKGQDSKVDYIWESNEETFYQRFNHVDQIHDSEPGRSSLLLEMQGIKNTQEGEGNQFFKERIAQLSNRGGNFQLDPEHLLQSAFNKSESWLQAHLSPGKFGWISLIEWLENGFFKVLISEAVLAAPDELETEGALGLQSVVAACLKVLEVIPGEAAYLFVDAIFASLREITDGYKEDLQFLHKKEIHAHSVFAAMGDKVCLQQDTPSPKDSNVEPPKITKFPENSMRDKQLQTLPALWRLNKLLLLVVQGSSVAAAVIAESGGLLILLELLTALVGPNYYVTSHGSKMSSIYDFKSKGNCVLPGGTLPGEKLPLKINTCLGNGWSNSNTGYSYSKREPCPFNLSFSEYQNSTNLRSLPTVQNADWQSTMEETKTQPRIPSNVAGKNLRGGQNKQTPPLLLAGKRPEIPKLGMNMFRQSFLGHQHFRQQDQLYPIVLDSSSSERTGLSDNPRMIKNLSQLWYDVQWFLLSIFSIVCSNNTLSLLRSREELRPNLSGKLKLQLADSFIRIMIGAPFIKISSSQNFTRSIVFKVVSNLDEFQTSSIISSVEGRLGFSWRASFCSLLVEKIASHLSNVLEGRSQLKALSENHRKKGTGVGNSVYPSRIPCTPFPKVDDKARQVEPHRSKLWITVGSVLWILMGLICKWPEEAVTSSVIDCCGKQIELIFTRLAESGSPACWNVGQVLAMNNVLLLVVAATSGSLKKTTNQGWNTIDKFFWQIVVENKLHWDCATGFIKWIMFDACEACLQSLAEGYPWSFSAESEHAAIKRSVCVENVYRISSSAESQQKEGIIAFLKAIILLIQRRLTCQRNMEGSLSLLMPQGIVSLLDVLMDPVQGLLMQVLKGSSYSNVTQTERSTCTHRDHSHLQDNMLPLMPLCTQREFIARPEKHFFPDTVTYRDAYSLSIKKELDTMPSATATEITEQSSFCSDSHHVSFCERHLTSLKHFACHPKVIYSSSYHRHQSAHGSRKPLVTGVCRTDDPSLIHENIHLEAMVFGLKFETSKDPESYTASKHLISHTNPFLSSKYVDPFLDYHYLSFLKLYNVSAPTRGFKAHPSQVPLQRHDEIENLNPRGGSIYTLSSKLDTHLPGVNGSKAYFRDSQEDDKISSECLMHVEVLIALATNQTEDVNLKFRKLKIMDFLVHQIALEYEASHVATPRDLLTLEQMETHQTKSVDLESSFSPSMQFHAKITESSNAESRSAGVARRKFSSSSEEGKIKVLDENMHPCSCFAEIQGRVSNVQNQSCSLSCRNCFQPSVSFSSLMVPSSRGIEETLFSPLSSPKCSSASPVDNDCSQVVFPNSNEIQSESYLHLQNSHAGLLSTRNLLSLDLQIQSDCSKEQKNPLYSGRFFDLNEEVERQLAQEDLDILLEETAAQDSDCKLEELVVSSDMEPVEKDGRVARKTNNKNEELSPEPKILARPFVPRLNLPKSTRKGEQELSSEKDSLERIVTSSSFDDLKCRKKDINNDKGFFVDDVFSNHTSGSTDKTLKSCSLQYEFERMRRRIYRSPSLHVALLELYMSLMLNPQSVFASGYSFQLSLTKFI